MVSITQEQQKRLEGFTEQRDKLVAEISDLSREKDSIFKHLNEASTELSRIKTEVAENERTVTDSASHTERELASHKEKKLIISKEITELTEKKESLKKEVSSAINEVAEAKEAVKGLLSFVNETVVAVSNLKKEAQNAVDTVVNSASEVSRNVTSVSNLVGEFHNQLVAKEAANEIRRVELDKRETALLVREEAINRTYKEITERMKHEGVFLEELNKVPFK